MEELGGAQRDRGPGSFSALIPVVKEKNFRMGQGNQVVTAGQTDKEGRLQVEMRRPVEAAAGIS